MRVVIRNGWPPACLMGRREEARTFVEDYARASPDYFAGFAEPFHEMLNRERH